METLKGEEARKFCNSLLSPISRKIEDELKEKPIYSLRNPEDCKKGYWEERGKYIGFDNSTNDCWVEDFDTEEEVINWLNE